MALTATFKSSVHSTTAATSYATTTTYTPTYGTLQMAWIMDTATDGNLIPGVTGCGLTWVQAFNSAYGTSGALSLFVASAIAPTSGTVTAGTWGSNRTGCHISVVEVDGSNVVNAGALGAVVVGNQPSNNGSTGTGSLTFATAAATDNRFMAMYHHTANEVTTPRTNWTELDDGSFATPASGMEVQWRSDTAETTSTATWTSSTVAWVAAGIEIVAYTGPRRWSVNVGQGVNRAAVI